MNYLRLGKYFVAGALAGLPVLVTFADTVGWVAVVGGKSMRVRKWLKYAFQVNTLVNFQSPPQPTLNPKGSSTSRDIVWVSRWDPQNGKLQPGDVVAFRLACNQRLTLT